ncbi:MAG: hypothetical protein IPO67_28465 [Deltaproteobacteria bacterium]|nr:hypothetical protein [Deltaproteobacteria bacterium]
MTGVDLVDRDPRYVERVDMAPWEREVLRFFEAHVFHLPLPAGAVVELGTARGNNFRRLCEVYGDARCIGYDVANYSGHPHIFERDVRALARTEDRPIALAFNDLSDWTLSPDSKRAGLHYATRNLVVGGLYIDAAFDARGLAWADEHLQDYELVVEDRLIALFRKRAVERAPPPPTERRAIDHGTSPLAASLRVDFRSTPYGAQLVSRARQDDTALDAVVDGLLARPVAPSLIRTTRCGPRRRLEGQTRSVFIDLAGMAPDAAAPVRSSLRARSRHSMTGTRWLTGCDRRRSARLLNYGHRPMSEHFPRGAEGAWRGDHARGEARKLPPRWLSSAATSAVYGEFRARPHPLALLRHSLDVEARSPSGCARCCPPPASRSSRTPWPTGSPFMCMRTRDSQRARTRMGTCRRARARRSG